MSKKGNQFTRSQVAPCGSLFDSNDWDNVPVAQHRLSAAGTIAWQTYAKLSRQ
jgi:hypothetical protein